MVISLAMNGNYIVIFSVFGFVSTRGKTKVLAILHGASWGSDGKP